jgi:hypothetical protein
MNFQEATSDMLHLILHMTLLQTVSEYVLFKQVHIQ